MPYKVHCIEDNQIMQKIYKKMMDSVDFADEIITAKNGLEGINFYKKLINNGSTKHKFPDLIFLDLNMPVMNGWKFLDEFVQLPMPELITPEIVIITSSVNPEDEERAKNYESVVAYVTKPLSMESLIKLKERLDGQSL